MQDLHVTGKNVPVCSAEFITGNKWQTQSGIFETYRKIVGKKEETILFFAFIQHHVLQYFFSLLRESHLCFPNGVT